MAMPVYQLWVDIMGDWSYRWGAGVLKNIGMFLTNYFLVKGFDYTLRTI